MPKEWLSLPKGFTLHPKLARHYITRRDALQEGRPVDWAMAEGLAFGTLIQESGSDRLTGQDTRRGTFSQRHRAAYHVKTGQRHVPLSDLAQHQCRFDIFDSPLSETAALGFQFGYSLDDPNTLVLWETNSATLPTARR